MNSDFNELIAEFNAHSVEFLVVGAHALAAHGHVRARRAQLIDVWVRPEVENAGRVLAALRSFGAPLHDLTVTDLATPGVVFQIGVAPVRIDVLTAIDGVTFADAWSGRVQEHLIENKRASGRLQDLADVERLMSEEQD